MYGRITDLIDIVPDTTTLRLSTSGFFQEGALFARADIGFDIPIDKGEGIDIDPLVRLNLAVGYGSYTTAQWTAMFEIATVATTADQLSASERFVHTAAVTIASKKYNFFASFIVPLDEGVRGNAYILSVGFHMRFANETKDPFRHYGVPHVD